MPRSPGGTVEVEADSTDAPVVGPDRGRARWRDDVRGVVGGVGRVVGRLDRVLVAIVAVGGALRVWGLGAQSLWYDEWLTAEAASGSASHLYRYVTDQAGIPPTYFTLMWGWVRVFGDGEASLRAVSALLGVATIPVVYAVARELGQRRWVARAAAVLVAVNPLLVWYSQEARPYSLVAFLGALSLLALARVWTRGQPRDLALWALACACTVAVHYFAIFLVVAEALAALAMLAVRRPEWMRRRPSWRQLALACVPAGVVLAALAPFAVRQFSRRDNHSWITDFPLADRLSDSGHSALVGPSPPDGRLWMAVVAVSAVAIVLLVARGDRDERRSAAAAGGLGVLSVALALGAVAVGLDVIIARYLIVSLVPFIVAVAVGLGVARAPRGVGGTAVVALCAFSLVSVVADAREPSLQRADWGAVADAHRAGGTATGNRLLVFNVYGNLARPLHWYLDGERELGPDESISVEQIDVVVAKPTTKPCSLFVGLECGMIFLGTPPPEPLPGHLRLDESIDLDQFVIDRYRTDGSLTVTAADLVSPYDLPRSLVLVTGDD
jgi:mannosyltransferase